MDNTTIGARIRRRRLQCGISLTTLAQHAGVSKSLLSQLENGVRDGQRTAVGIISKIAEALGVTIDCLAGTYADEDADPAPAPAPGRSTVCVSD